ncbi:sphingomyelin phosphodiesterase 5 [Myxocyprinus asiaticus]|uniref:sphingomyelin phosphodiesterase 5 n=1 Tax=Myxocyprinus asiaticus TaxID=70543 RepID=UPI0022222712|nr:sphingomyelin phosphodiesterase 5 [Myxocyprinus asiaticus]XP_051576164.1 sphingomyelin phosphodiesterase 5 [Myxocyprinus asiaticus]XP_051576165.1 sphingomyelin phosphodiesterase 5 [Myxocyprinus asiaticus]
MSLRESPFSDGILEALHAVGWGLIFPCFWFLDRLIANCVFTTLEREQRREELLPLQVIFGSILFFILFLISTPFALLGFVLWAPLQAVRRPFSYHQQVPIIPMEDRNARWEETDKVSFGFVSANLCLLPDGLARVNNLGHTQQRAEIIGQNIVQGVTRPHIRIFVDSPSSCGTVTPSSSLLPQAAPSTYGSVDPAAGQVEGAESDGNIPNSSSRNSVASSEEPDGSKPNCNQNSNQHGSQVHRHPPRALRTLFRDSDVPMEVSALFPPTVDIVCLEEVFDKRAAFKLMRALGPLYGHVIYDVGVYAFQPPGTCSSFKFFNSGLFVASRFPVIEARYNCFPNGCGEDALAAKGLLSLKVEIGLQKGDKKMVGYFNCTHLHAPEGHGGIRFEQLNMLTKWINEFQAGTKKADEMVMFDVLCGDFNFDNCSPDDNLEQRHGLFEDYRDPCRAGPGQEKPWVIGTLLEQPTLYHENVRTPDNLQRTLESEELRSGYLSSPVPMTGVPMVYPKPDQPWVGRRIDYLLYRENSISSHCKTEVEEFTYVTQLAGLTDHIPVGFSLCVTLGPEDI